MAQSKKTDNHNPTAKLALRRYFLQKYHADEPANVLDCCQGSGVLWSRLRQEFALAGYWGLDLKRKKGRLKLDSVRVLAQPGWTQNVIDIDTYGSPWKHWAAMLPNVTKSVTVFLTIGKGMQGLSNLDSIAAQSMGLTIPNVPIALLASLWNFYLSYCLTRCCDYDILITEAVEAVSSGNARYLGVRLEKVGRAVASNPA